MPVTFARSMDNKSKRDIGSVCVRTGLLVAALLLAVPLAWAMPRGISGGDATVHHFNLSCIQCHLEPEENSLKPVGELFGDRIQMCVQCHPIDSTFDHPVGVTVSMPPANLPLDENSQITCLTCHEEVQAVDRVFDVSFSKPYLLRQQGFQLCASCHDAMGSTMKERSHWQFSTFAHLDRKRINRQSDVGFKPDISVGLVDVESHTCLGCHDDMSVAIGKNSSAGFDAYATRMEHPIGIDYAEAVFDNSREFRYPLSDQDGIRLFSGKVGCGSCHSLYSTSSNHLVSTFDNGILCRTCHIK